MLKQLVYAKQGIFVLDSPLPSLRTIKQAYRPTRRDTQGRVRTIGGGQNKSLIAVCGLRVGYVGSVEAWERGGVGGWERGSVGKRNLRSIKSEITSIKPQRQHVFMCRFVFQFPDYYAAPSNKRLVLRSRVLVISLHSGSTPPLNLSPHGTHMKYQGGVNHAVRPSQRRRSSDVREIASLG